MYLRSAKSIAFKIASIYACFSILWILFSDQVLFYFVEETGRMARFQTIKGWLFVLTTAGLIFLLLQKEIKRYQESDERLQQFRNLLTSIINSMPSVLIGVNSEGNIIQWNREAEKLTGISEGDAQGKSLNKLLVQSSPAQLKIDQAIKRGQILKNEKMSWETNGEIKHYEVTVTPLATDDIEGAVIRVDDITEKSRLEELMIQTEKMMLVGGLTAGMAHEINNPLSSILQSTQNIVRRLSVDLKQNQLAAANNQIDLHNLQSYLKERDILQYLETIRKSGKRAAEIITNMLLFSRKSETQKELVDVAGLIENAIELANKDFNLRKNYDFKKVHLVREFDPNLKSINCAEIEIEQVILNLLSNAVHAMFKQDTDRQPQIILRTLNEGDKARIEVEDNGPGISESVRKRVFEPFFTTKSVGKGTGLGLSVSFTIITNNHSGTLELESEVGKGSKFIIRLPLNQKSGA